MAIGAMNISGKLQKNTPTTTATGGGVDVFSDVVTCWGELKKVRGSRILDSGEALLSSSFTWRVYKQAAITSALNKSCRWVIDSKNYAIASIDEDDPVFLVFVLNQSQ